MGADPKKPELKDLKEANRAGADDDCFNVLFRHVIPDFRLSKSARIVTECASAQATRFHPNGTYRQD
jgi:hypothetical protein